MSARPGPLAGVRVLEVGHVLAGPFGGMLLADLGVDVIKIEPIDGDLSRQVGSRSVDAHNVYFASLNRNKRSVYIDLTTEPGQQELGALARTAHALLVNLRPSTIRTLGLDYESLRRFNPTMRGLPRRTPGSTTGMPCSRRSGRASGTRRPRSGKRDYARSGSRPAR